MRIIDYIDSHLPHRRMHGHHARMAWLASAVPAKLRSALPRRYRSAVPGRIASTAAMMMPRHTMKHLAAHLPAARHAGKGLSGGVVALAAAVVFASWFLMRRD
jgi:hypothetical protein